MYTCRRPYCSRPSATEEARNAHENDSTHPSHNTHPELNQMDYLCENPSHADAIDEYGFCPECQ